LGKKTMEKRKWGAPRKGEAVRRGVNFSVEPSEADALSDEAKSYGICRSDLIRYRCGLPVDLKAGLVIAPPGWWQEKQTEIAACGSIDVPVMSFPCLDGTWDLMPGKLAEIQRAFPGWDCLTICDRARLWIVGNPGRVRVSRMDAWLFRWVRNEKAPPLIKRAAARAASAPDPFDDAKAEAIKAETMTAFEAIKKIENDLKAAGFVGDLRARAMEIYEMELKR
jgi:hypothetical protein